MHPLTDSEDHKDEAPHETQNEDGVGPDANPVASEITRRITLLGKLILPPDPR